MLEARERVGGRTWSGVLDGAEVDWGGEWIGEGQPRIYQLIKELGLQGLKSGGAFMAHDDANLVLNDGRATSEDILSLIRSIQAEVWRRKGIALEADIQLVGFAEPAFSKVA